MPSAHRQPPHPPSRRRDRAAALLVTLALTTALTTALGAAVLLGGGLLRRAVGIVPCPRGDGAAPGRPQPIQASVPLAPLPLSRYDVGAVRLANADGSPAAPRPAGAIQLPSPARQGPDRLAAADESCRRLDWDSAARQAGACLALAPGASDAERARRIAVDAPRLAGLFAGLATTDALTRGYDTDPGLVSIETATGTLLAVGVRGGDARHPQLIESDAVAACARALAAGPLQALVQGASGFVLTTLAPAGITAVKPVDQRALHQRLARALDLRVARLDSGARAGDALAWYALGAFAYQHRLDDRVFTLLDRALGLDPQLLRSVREDRAAQLSAAMVLALHRGSRPQAAIFLGLIRERYADTDQGRRAALLFAGRQQELLAFDERLHPPAAAPPSGAPAAAKPAAAPGPGTDLAAAQCEIAAGMPPYQQAMTMGAVAGRNQVYRDALAHFLAAQRIIQALVASDPENAGLHALQVEVNSDCFGCRKGLSDD